MSTFDRSNFFVKRRKKQTSVSKFLKIHLTKNEPRIVQFLKANQYTHAFLYFYFYPESKKNVLFTKRLSYSYSVDTGQREIITPILRSALRRFDASPTDQLDNERRTRFRRIPAALLGAPAAFKASRLEMCCRSRASGIELGNRGDLSRNVRGRSSARARTSHGLVLCIPPFGA